MDEKARFYGIATGIVADILLLFLLIEWEKMT